ncbi:MAG TPA: hypothetical protein VKA48_04085, partial [Gammaproteobacteria bacterium]|nr:hypothetical protein [Gammaproteobacteria bacterium]
PRIKEAVRGQGLTPGTQDYRDFFRNAQTVVDAGDPINYAAQAATKHAIHMIEVVGGSGSYPDQVIPNSATDILQRTMGLTRITGTTNNTNGIEGLVQFTAGDHRSLLDGSTSQNATTEMQSEMAYFAGSAGTYLPIYDGSVVKQ